MIGDRSFHSIFRVGDLAARAANASVLCLPPDQALTLCTRAPPLNTVHGQAIRAVQLFFWPEFDAPATSGVVVCTAVVLQCCGRLERAPAL
jgi:hypothetical protein